MAIIAVCLHMGRRDQANLTQCWDTVQTKA